MLNLYEFIVLNTFILHYLLFTGRLIMSNAAEEMLGIVWVLVNTAEDRSVKSLGELVYVSHQGDTTFKDLLIQSLSIHLSGVDVDTWISARVIKVSLHKYSLFWVSGSSPVSSLMHPCCFYIGRGNPYVLLYASIPEETIAVTQHTDNQPLNTFNMLTNHIFSYTHYPLMFNERKIHMPVNMTFNKLNDHFCTNKLGF